MHTVTAMIFGLFFKLLGVIAFILIVMLIFLWIKNKEFPLIIRSKDRDIPIDVGNEDENGGDEDEQNKLRGRRMRLHRSGMQARGDMAGMPLPNTGLYYDGQVKDADDAMSNYLYSPAGMYGMPYGYIGDYGGDSMLSNRMGNEERMADRKMKQSGDENRTDKQSMNGMSEDMKMSKEMGSKTDKEMDRDKQSLAGKKGSGTETDMKEMKVDKEPKETRDVNEQSLADTKEVKVDQEMDKEVGRNEQSLADKKTDKETDKDEHSHGKSHGEHSKHGKHSVHHDELKDVQVSSLHGSRDRHADRVDVMH